MAGCVSPHAYGADLIEGVTDEGVFSAPKGDPIDLDLKPYKIVNNGAFGYNPSRLNLGSIAYRTDGLCIVSHLYIVFYLNEKGKERIEPEYLYTSPPKERPSVHRGVHSGRNPARNSGSRTLSAYQPESQAV